MLPENNDIKAGKHKDKKFIKELNKGYVNENVLSKILVQKVLMKVYTKGLKMQRFIHYTNYTCSLLIFSLSDFSFNVNITFYLRIKTTFLFKCGCCESKKIYEL